MLLLFITSIVSPALCDPLPVLVNGNISYTNPPGELEAGTEANYNCDLGFLIDPENGNTRTCLTGGTWSGTSPTCRESTAYQLHVFCKAVVFGS